jgi:chemotaxis protein methyltransferase CheR
MEPSAVLPLASHEFEKIRKLAYRTFGLDLKSGKEELVSARLSRLVRKGGFRRFADYYHSVLADTTGAGLAAMVDALATNHTSFLREPEHFEFLRRKVLPQLAGQDILEVWSAACATGEEAWTLAMLLREEQPERRVHITGTDISRKALATAEKGTYPRDSCRVLPPAWLGKYFVAEGTPRTYRVAPELRSLVSFRRVNLVKAYHWGRRFPVIFCRNVMIYFDKPTQEQVIRQLSDTLEPGGYLFVGHAESLTRVSHSLEYVQPAVYRKPPRKGAAWNRS